MANSIHVRRARWLAGAGLIVLVTLSFLPSHWKAMLHTKGQMHDAGHMVAFGLLAWLLARCGRTREQGALFLAFTALLGVIIELAQDARVVLPKGSWSPVEWHDVLLDTMAVVMAGVVYFAAAPARRASMRVSGSQG